MQDQDAPKNKVQHGLRQGMVLGCQGPTGNKQPHLICMLFWAVHKISEETHYVFTTPYKLKMVEEWEAFIIEAQEEWVELEAWCPLSCIEEQSPGKDEGSDDSLASNKGNLILTSPPSCFVCTEERPDLPMPGWFEQKAQADS